MSMSLVAILLSLAMMLTGAGGEGMPAQSARTLVLHNVAVTYNGDTVRLAPEARLGAASDGESAVFDFGVDLNGNTLLPIQLGVGEKGLTALFKESGVAVNVTAEALDGVMALASEGMGAMMAGAEDSELMKFITEEYLPAYTGLINAVADKDFQAAIKEKGEALFDGIVDRGEGTPEVISIDDVDYDVLTYHYAIENAQMCALADGAYDVAPELSAYRDALMKLYDMMPAESGLNGLTSISGVMDRFGMQMRMDVDEQRTEDGKVDVMDAVLTLDMSGVPAAMMALNGETVEEPVEEAVEEAVEDGQAPEDGAVEDVQPEPTPEPVELPPMVVNLHSIAVDDVTSFSFDFNYEVQGSGVEFSMNAAQEPTTISMDMIMGIRQNGEKVARVNASCVQAANADGGTSYGMNYGMVVKDAIQLDVSAYGDATADGLSNNTVNMDGRTPDASFGLSFDLDVTDDPIEDQANAAEPAMVIDDLSEEKMNALGEDQTFGALMMKVGGSLALDASKLTSDASINNLVSLLNGERLPIVVEDAPEDQGEYTYEIDGGDGFVIEGLEDGEGDYEPAEDDGELGFNAPELTFLPDGWTVGNVETDTAYDWVGISVTDENGAEAMYATFFKDMDGEVYSYIVNDKGAVQEGRAMGVSNYGEGGMVVTIRENGLYGNLSFASDAIDVDTLGRIVAGIAF